SSSSFSLTRLPPRSTLFPYTTLFRSQSLQSQKDFAYLKASPKDDSWWSRFWMWLRQLLGRMANEGEGMGFWEIILTRVLPGALADRKSTRLNSSHVKISYAVFCLKKK